MEADALEEALRDDAKVPREHRLGAAPPDPLADPLADLIVQMGLERCAAELEGGGRCPAPAYEVCKASCCASVSPTPAHCNVHSHRPRAVLDVLGYPIGHFGDKEQDVLALAQKMWMGAGLVFENAGRFELLRRQGKP